MSGIKRLIVKIYGNLIYYIFLIPSSRKRKDETKKTDFHSILTISEVDKKGGAAKLAYRLHTFLLTKNIDSKMVVGMVTEAEDGIHLLKQRDGIFTRALHKSDKIGQWFDFFRLSSFDILKMKIFKDANLVHMHNLHVNYFSKFVLPKLTSKKRTIWTLHDTVDLFEDFPDKFSKTGELKTYPNLDDKRRKYLRDISERIINNSYLTVATPSKWLFEKAKRGVFKNQDIRLIYNGVDETVFKPYDKVEVRKELGLPVDKKILLFSAAWGLSDGTKDSKSTLLKMYEHLKSNKDIFFAILGGGSEEFGENSVNIPYISDDNLLAKYYSAADLFIYPSLWDNCPLAVLENMGTATPVITYKTGGIPELVEHMKTGYIAEYNNSDDFIKGIDIFLTDENLRSSASKLSRSIFEQKFTQTKMVNEYLDLYNELLNR